MKIKVMRGISGSGKSTYAKTLARAAYDAMEKPLICSADHYFVGPDGYKFDGSKLGDAHKFCMMRFLGCIQDGMSPIIVDNTNINIEDIAPYVAVGEALGYDVEIIQVNVDFELAARRNIHEVPRPKIQEMYRRLVAIKLPNRWKIVQVNNV